MSKKDRGEIYCLVIHHRQGMEIWPCESHQAAELQLQFYVQEWWAEEMGAKPMPRDPKEAVKAYFQAQVHKKLPLRGETCHIYLRDFVTAAGLRTSRDKKSKPADMRGKKMKPMPAETAAEA